MSHEWFDGSRSRSSRDAVKRPCASIRVAAGLRQSRTDSLSSCPSPCCFLGDSAYDSVLLTVARRLLAFELEGGRGRGGPPYGVCGQGHCPRLQRSIVSGFASMIPGPPFLAPLDLVRSTAALSLPLTVGLRGCVAAGGQPSNAATGLLRIGGRRRGSSVSPPREGQCYTLKHLRNLPAMRSGQCASILRADRTANTMRKAISLGLTLACGLLAGLMSLVAQAHEGHDHDKPPPLNLPVAPRVVAVTPELELVGVLSGKDRLTVFLHKFATNEPVAGASMTVSADSDTVEAKPEGDGVFTVAAPWISNGGAADLIFALTLADGSEDLLTGRLEVPHSLDKGPAVTKPDNPGWLNRLSNDPVLSWAVGASFAAGVLLTLFFAAGVRSRAPRVTADPHSDEGTRETDPPASRSAATAVTRLRRTAGALILSALAATAVVKDARAAGSSQDALVLPSVPSTMATDQPQRMPDATLFVPKATQHLLAIRTQLVERAKTAKAIKLTGRVIVGPQNLGHVQSNRPGRFIAAGEHVGFVGMKVKAGQLLGFVETYIEAADRANIVSQIAETEARIAKNRTILSRYESRPGFVPETKVDEVRGELQALIRRREELLPSTSAREPLVAPINGVISAARVVLGQVVESRDVLFEIIDPSEFWIEAVSPHTEDIEGVSSAMATVHDHHTLDLEYLGRGLALRNHSTVLNFKVLTAGEELAVGMTARVILRLDRETEGFVLPTSAVVRGPTGLPIVWLKSAPERFEPQIVKVEPFDGDNVVVTAGLKQDQRVVTDGVTLLNQIR